MEAQQEKLTHILTRFYKRHENWCYFILMAAGLNDLHVSVKLKNCHCEHTHLLIHVFISMNPSNQPVFTCACLTESKRCWVWIKVINSGSTLTLKGGKVMKTNPDSPWEYFTKHCGGKPKLHLSHTQMTPEGKRFSRTRSIIHIAFWASQIFINVTISYLGEKFWHPT